MATNVDITNRALATIGTRSQITSMTDGSTEALYANILYNELLYFMLAEGDYDFAMTDILAIPATAPPHIWKYSYEYPQIALRIRQVVPVNYNPLNPEPVEWNVFSNTVSRYILTNTEASILIITYSPPEDYWSPIFTEAFVRLLASGLAFALENRIEASNTKLSEALSFAGIANMRDD